MESVIRPTLVYLFVLVLLRLTGKRTLAQITSFDFVLLLIISEATQQALIGEDNSMINSAIVVSTLVGVLFGTVPATRAAQLDPVESLRYE